jgi:predicted DNA-binding transcriptional regulator YafY
MRRSAQFRNGSLTRIASVGWLLRTVLQYGAEAEVLGPPVYREAVKRAVGAVDDRKS